MPWIKCGSIKETRTVWGAGLSAQGGTNYVVVSTLMIAEIRFRSQWCRKAGWFGEGSSWGIPLSEHDAPALHITGPDS